MSVFDQKVDIEIRITCKISKFFNTLRIEIRVNDQFLDYLNNYSKDFGESVHDGTILLYYIVYKMFCM